jgi:hypothetical protein
MLHLRQPMVFADEFMYAFLTMHFGHEAAIANAGWTELDFPNRLFFALYHALIGTTIEPYASARAVNVLFVVTAFAALMYFVRRAHGRHWGYIAAFAGLVGPSTTYAAYFMPESLYIALFYWLIITAAEAILTRRMALGALAGAFAACLMLVKPHGMVPTLIVGTTMALVAARTPGKLRRGAWATVGSFALTALALRTLLAWRLAPEGAQSAVAIGTLYSKISEKATATVLDPWKFLPLLELVGIHLLIALLLAAPALLAAVYCIPGLLANAWREDSDEQVRLARLALTMTTLVCAASIVMTAVFTVAVTGTSVFELDNRLHLRYYAFCLPLIVVAFACTVRARPLPQAIQYAHYGVWLLVAAILIFVLPQFVWYFPDAPDLFLGVRVQHWWTALLVLGIASALLVANRLWSKLSVANVFVIGFVTIGFITAAAVHRAQLREEEHDADRIGRIAASMARTDDVPLLIVGNGYPPDVWRIGSFALERAQFSQQSAVTVAARLASMPALTVITGSTGSLKEAGLTPSITIGDYGVARSSATGGGATSLDPVARQVSP